MTTTEFAMLVTILERRPAGTDAGWDDGMEEIYRIGLRNLPDGIMQVLIEAVIDMAEPWRPTVGQIKQLVLDRFAPQVPRAAAALDEVRAAIRRFGVHGQRIPGTNSYVAGEPAWTSPVIGATIRAFGGWDRVCENDDPSGVFAGQFAKLYDQCAAAEGERHLQAMREPGGFERLAAERDKQLRRLADPAPERPRIVDVTPSRPRLPDIDRRAEIDAFLARVGAARSMDTDR